MEINGTLLSSSKAGDPSPIKSAESEGECVIAIQDADEKEGEEILDGSEFVFLMTQVLSDAVSNKKEEPSSGSEEIGCETIKLPNCESSINQDDPEQLSSDIDKNVAVAWIDSESFQSQLLTPIEIGGEYGEVMNQFLAKKIDLLPSNEENTGDQNVLASKLDSKSYSDLNSLSQKFHTTDPLKLPDNELVLQNSENKGELTQNLVQVGLNQPQNSTTFSATKSLDTPINIYDSQWANEFSEQIVWLGQQGIKSALIKIHPEDLGPLEINISVVKDSATVNITSHNDQARSIVEEALPRLREMITEQGLTVSDLYVGVDSNKRQFSEQQQKNDNNQFVTDVEEDITFTPIKSKTYKGLIDYFA
ncbi:MAG: flagellar hook-length control protein FliK [bacterium]|nr:flagellar hook-length control protein FliK [bacterium]